MTQYSQQPTTVNPEEFFANQSIEPPPWLKPPQNVVQPAQTPYSTPTAPINNNYRQAYPTPQANPQSPSYGPANAYNAGSGVQKKPKHFTLRATTPKDPKWGPGLSASLTAEGAQELGNLLNQCNGDLRRLRFSVMIYDKLFAEVKATGQGYGVKPVGGGFFGLKKEWNNG